MDRGDIDFSPLSTLGDYTPHPVTSPEETISRLAETTIVITNKVLITEEVLAACPKIQLICAAATGVNHIDLDAATKRNIPVCNVAGYSTPTVAQHTFTLLLNLANHIHTYAKEAQLWPQSPIFTRLDHPVIDLAGKTLGIIGLGDIGKAVARIAGALDMNVIALAREGLCTVLSPQKQKISFALKPFAS